ncbi:glutaredoxin-C6-like [Cimex lectularius]|uniref:Glutaredoxin domain-containing protein n=1 Tax=Cimex lectularius TaxID=79782 RepID=A0A8I6RC68_CIMLE|nr:glutaredoxin-C6-like [Cimex lectularius]
MGCSCCKNCNKNGCSCCCCKNSKGETKHEAELRELIHYGRVVIFSKTVCPFCDDAKKMFRLMNSDYAAMELDDLSPNHGLIKALKAKTGYTTVPQVFIDGRFVGGLCDLKALKNSGELQKLLCQVNPACITTKSMRTNTGCSPIYPKTDEGPCRNNCSAVTSTKRIRKKADRCQDPYEVLGKMGNRYPPGCKVCSSI